MKLITITLADFIAAQPARGEPLWTTEMWGDWYRKHGIDPAKVISRTIAEDQKSEVWEVEE